MFVVVYHWINQFSIQAIIVRETSFILASLICIVNSLLYKIYKIWDLSQSLFILEQTSSWVVPLQLKTTVESDPCTSLKAFRNMLCLHLWVNGPYLTDIKMISGKENIPMLDYCALQLSTSSVLCYVESPLNLCSFLSASQISVWHLSCGSSSDILC